MEIQGNKSVTPGAQTRLYVGETVEIKGFDYKNKDIYLKNGNYEKIILDYRMKEKYNGNNSKKTYMEWRENSLAGKQNSGNHSG